MSTKNSSDNIRNRTYDLPTRNALHQPSAPPSVPDKQRRTTMTFKNECVFLVLAVVTTLLLNKGAKVCILHLSYNVRVILLFYYCKYICLYTGVILRIGDSSTELAGALKFMYNL